MQRAGEDKEKPLRKEVGVELKDGLLRARNIGSRMSPHKNGEVSGPPDDIKSETA